MVHTLKVHTLFGGLATLMNPDSIALREGRCAPRPPRFRGVHRPVLAVPAMSCPDSARLPHPCGTECPFDRSPVPVAAHYDFRTVCSSRRLHRSVPRSAINLGRQGWGRPPLPWSHIHHRNTKEQRKWKRKKRDPVHCRKKTGRAGKLGRPTAVPTKLRVDTISCTPQTAAAIAHPDVCVSRIPLSASTFFCLLSTGSPLAADRALSSHTRRWRHSDPPRESAIAPRRFCGRLRTNKPFAVVTSAGARRRSRQSVCSTFDRCCPLSPPVVFRARRHPPSFFSQRRRDATKRYRKCRGADEIKSAAATPGLRRR